MRRGDTVRYVENQYKDIAGNQKFQVIHKVGSQIELMFPTRYMNGEVHKINVLMPMKDFEKI